MSVIQVENLTFSYQSGDKLIFDNVNLSISTEWKLGFIGRNGRGKTTFLNILTGKLDYKGKIISPVGFDYFPYPVPDMNALVSDVLRDICPVAEDWQFMRELSLLDVDADVLYRPFGTLSYGEQTKVLLAALFLNEGRFLLIDEPTNHLDCAARKIVSEYLRRKKGFILVSHDREFLDGCVDHILSLNKCDIVLQNGNFSTYLEEFDKRQDFERKQSARLQADIRRLQVASSKNAVWADKVEASKNGTRNSGLRPDKGYIGHKSAKLMKRAKVVEARRQREIEEKSTLLQNSETASKLKITPHPYKSEKLIAATDLCIYFGGRAVFKPVSFTVNSGEAVALSGVNGCGKSSILKLICGQKIDYTGIIDVGSGLSISYVPQHTADLRGSLTDLARNENIDESQFKAVLNKFGINKDLFYTDVSAFSEGQKKKIALAKSLCRKAHLYVWDEPLNYIDIYSRIQIEELVTEFKPTLLFVEHDSAFLKKIATKIVNVEKLKN